MHSLFASKRADTLRFFAIQLLVAAACAYPLAIFLGFSTLANAVLVNLFQTITVCFLLGVLHFVVRRVTCFLVSVLFDKPQKAIADSMSLYWFMVVIDVLLLCFALVVLLLVWGVYPQSVYDFIDVVLFKGVKVGQTSFSVLFILKAVVVYCIVYYLAKLIILLIKKRVLPFTRLDNGTKEALLTILGYIGVLFAVVMALYSLGINSTSLAFVISAFTLGISFGLKEIFNNFVSGIILLIERPIKVGDWVDVGSESGEVKQIRLRATMIETFDKKTLLVPNSQFITSTVSNDLYNPISRSIIVIECSYDDNPEFVRDLLLEVATSQDGVLSTPAPSAVFTGFNESGLEFKLRFFCATDSKLGITSRMRFAILDAFRANNIEIPYPKQDLYIKEFSGKG